MLSAWTPLAGGEPGTRSVLQRLTSLKNHYGRLPVIRSAALHIAGSTRDHDQAGHVQRLFAWVQHYLVYVCDPYNAELVVTPDLMLYQVGTNGVAFGDCDDHVLLYASLAESLGIPTDPIGVKTPDSSAWNHVIAASQFDDGSAVYLDLIAKGIPQPSYSEMLLA